MLNDGLLSVFGSPMRFKAIKTAGFNIEDTHLTDPKRLEKLFAIVCIAFVWVYLVGDYQNQVKKISILSHNRRAFSIFRYGLDAINKALLFDKQLVIVYSQLLTCTVLTAKYWTPDYPYFRLY